MRRRQNAALPRYVYRRKSGYIYRAYLGRKDGRTVRGKDIPIGDLSTPIPKLYEAVERLQRKQAKTLRWLLSEYHASPAYKKLSHRTQTEDYPGYRAKLTEFKTKRGKPLGDALLTQFSKRTIRAYLDKYPAPVAANRHIQYLKAAWNWAEERHEIPANPCSGVRLNAEKSRTRYVSQQEYQAAYALAGGYIRLFMEFAYLCRARRSEISNLRVADWTAEGLHIRRSKGSEGEITAKTQRLARAVEAARAFHSGAPAPISGEYLIHNAKGQQITKNAFDSAWQRFMVKVQAAGVERFTFHDLKASGYTDQQEQFAGHKDKSGKMHRVYNRKLRVVRPAE